MMSFNMDFICFRLSFSSNKLAMHGDPKWFFAVTQEFQASIGGHRVELFQDLVREQLCIAEWTNQDFEFDFRIFIV